MPPVPIRPLTATDVRERLAVWRDRGLQLIAVVCDDRRDGLVSEPDPHDVEAAAAADEIDRLAVAAPDWLDFDVLRRRQPLDRPAAVGADDPDIEITAGVDRARDRAAIRTPLGLEVVPRALRQRDGIPARGRHFPDVALHRERDPLAVGTPDRLGRSRRDFGKQMPFHAIAESEARWPGLEAEVQDPECYNRGHRHGSSHVTLDSVRVVDADRTADAGAAIRAAHALGRRIQAAGAGGLRRPTRRRRRATSTSKSRAPGHRVAPTASSISCAPVTTTRTASSASNPAGCSSGSTATPAIAKAWRTQTFANDPFIPANSNVRGTVAFAFAQQTAADDAGLHQHA